jgi:hypothetical protein
MNLQEINNRRQELNNEVEPLVKLKKKLYSNIDISQPMSKEEKELNTKIANIFSELNSLVIEKRKLMGNV